MSGGRHKEINMKQQIKKLAIILGLLALGVLPVPAQDRGVEGDWIGSGEIGALKFKFALHIAKGSDGKLSGKFDSIDQGANGLEFDTVELTGSTLRCEAKALGVVFETVLNEKGDELTGALKQGPASYPIAFKRGGFRAANRPQTPKKPYPYYEEEVAYNNSSDGVKLAGTLTLPRAKGTVPAVILITGSGPQDRDETIMEHKPFLVLADHLTRHGIAVLRVDDRGVGGTSQGSRNATTENLVGDVLAGVAFLKGRKDIDQRRIGLIGHSEGGMVAPMAAIRSKDVAFIVMMAGLGQTGGDTILAQAELIAMAKGASTADIAGTLTAFKNIFRILKEHPDNKGAEKQISEALDKQLTVLREAERLSLGPQLESMKEQVQVFTSPWYRYFVAFDPRPVLKKISVPVLAIGGENDFQVPAKENLTLIGSALKAGGNKDYTTAILPKLNHIFQTCATGSPDEYGLIEETISPAALDVITKWVLAHTGAKRPTHRH